MANDRYVSPLSERYASREMQYIFSPEENYGSRWHRQSRNSAFPSRMSRLRS